MNRNPPFLLVIQLPSPIQFSQVPSLVALGRPFLSLAAPSFVGQDMVLSKPPGARSKVGLGFYSRSVVGGGEPVELL